MSRYPTVANKIAPPIAHQNSTGGIKLKTDVVVCSTVTKAVLTATARESAITPTGYIVATVSGEGKREFLDNLVQHLIEETSGQRTVDGESLQLLMLCSPSVCTPSVFGEKSSY